MTEKDLTHCAWKHFGSVHQLAKYKEELCEAVAALQRYEINPNPDTYQEMIEELADVELCTNYPRLIFREKDIDQAKHKKMLYLKELLKLQRNLGEKE